jgi:hypothetical protein
MQIWRGIPKKVHECQPDSCRYQTNFFDPVRLLVDQESYRRHFRHPWSRGPAARATTARSYHPRQQSPRPAKTQADSDTGRLRPRVVCDAARFMAKSRTCGQSGDAMAERKWQVGWWSVAGAVVGVLVGAVVALTFAGDPYRTIIVGLCAGIGAVIGQQLEARRKASPPG